MTSWPDRDLPAARVPAMRDHLVAEISQPRHRLSRRAGWLAALTGVVAIAGGGAALAGQVWDGGGAAMSDDIGCYATASLQADTAVISSRDRDPVELCADLWREGSMVHGVSQAPTLVSCLTNEGPVGVFPGGEGTCAALGLRPSREASPAERAEAIAVRAVRDEMIARFATCVPKEEAIALVRSLFTEHKLHNWTVQVDAERGKCATFGIDQEKKSVYLITMDHP